jgi:putative transposase
VFEAKEINWLPQAPMSHPFVERVIGSIRREPLDQTLFWTASDLENKLNDYQRYYNEHRCHSRQHGTTPAKSGMINAVDSNGMRFDHRID